MSKVINKAKLDELIGMVREYWQDINLTLADERANKMVRFAAEHFTERLKICELLHAILGGKFCGLKHDATNEDIYKVLEVLGWVVE